MTRAELSQAVAACKAETAAAIRTMYDALNQGQKKQIVKNEAVAELFARFGIERGE
jgi:hypothetical protein